MLECHIEALVLVPVGLPLVQLPVSVLGKAAQEDPSTWTPAEMNIRDPDGAPCSWF